MVRVGKSGTGMRIAIRADASIAIGTGHVMRCLAIAGALREQQADVVFVCREQEGHLCDLIEVQRFTVHRLPQSDDAHLDWCLDAEQTAEIFLRQRLTVDWLIIDHYGLDRKWEAPSRRFCRRVMVIDDLADRMHDCDMLLDQNYCNGMDVRYSGLVPHGCQLLLGPTYALLRPEFQRLRAMSRQRGGRLKHVLVFFGGSDPANETVKALEGLRQLDRSDLTVDVVVGGSNPHRAQVEALCDGLPNTVYHCQVSNMAELMTDADLSIGAGGTTTWERCCLGLPALVSILADNQAELTHAVSDFGASVNLGRANALKSDDYRKAVESLTSEQLAHMEQRCVALVDGNGAGRVAHAIMQSGH